jgi:uncharacterized RDD family membrane protein YckC
MGNLGNISYAGFWIRLLSYVFDLFIVSILGGIIAYIGMMILSSDIYTNIIVGTLEGADSAGSSSSLMATLILVAIFLPTVIIPFFIFPLFYYIYLPSTSIMGTFGKSILGLVIVDVDGNQIGKGKSLLRFIGWIISSIILYIGHIMCGFTENKKALHDMIASTHVVYKSTLESSGSIPSVMGDTVSSKDSSSSDYNDILDDLL